MPSTSFLCFLCNYKSNSYTPYCPKCATAMAPLPRESLETRIYGRKDDPWAKPEKKEERSNSGKETVLREDKDASWDNK